jgi:PhnB protein
MVTINPYLNFPGNTEEAFNFYKSVFGGDFLMLMRFKDSPEADKTPQNLKDKIMHVSLPIGKGNMLMATDALEEMGQKLTIGNNFYLSISTQSKEEADKVYNMLSAGGKIEVPISDSSWGSYFGMFSDKFGVKWMISYDYPKN